MIAIIHDCVRAVLVLVVLAVGLEILQVHREPRAWQPVHSWPQATNERPIPPAWQPSAPVYVQPAHERPLRRVASSAVDLAESVLGVFR